MALYKVALMMGLDVVVTVEAESMKEAKEIAEKDALAMAARLADRFPHAEVSLIDAAVVQS